MAELDLPLSGAARALARLGRASLAGGVLLGLVACDARNAFTPPPLENTSVDTVVVSPSTLPLLVGATGTLTAEARDSTGKAIKGKTVTWATASSAVATVTQGVVTAVGAGSTSITATAGGKTGSARVDVTAPAPVVIVTGWTSLGPVHIKGRFGSYESGKLQALAISLTDARIMYAAGGLGSGNQGSETGAGIFKSTDGGAHWTSMNTGLTDPTVNALWVSPGSPTIALAGTEHDGIFRTTDGGQRWTRVGDLGATSEFAAIGSGLLAATARGIVSSSDQGATWTVDQATSSPVRALAVGGTALIAGLENGDVLMKTGTAWRTAKNNPGRTVWAVAMHPNSLQTAFAVLGNHPSALMRTQDGGVTWSAITPPCAVPTAPSQALIFSTFGRLHVGCSGGTVATTIDSGVSWTAFDNASAWDVRKLFLSPGNQTSLFVGTDQGLFSTGTQGVTWLDVSPTVPSSILFSVAVRGSTIFTAAQDFNPLLSFDGGSSWQQPAWTSASPPTGEGGLVLINPGNATYCYAYTSTGFQVSSDGCRTFRLVGTTAVAPIVYQQPGWANLIAVDPTAPATVYVASLSGGVLKSTDWGNTLTPTGWTFTQPTAVAVDPLDGKIVYVGTKTGLSRTLDGGATWTALTLGASGWPTTLAIDPKDPKIVLVGLSAGAGQGGGVVRTSDRGATFKRANAGLSTTARSSVCCGIEATSLRFSASGLAALATANGVYVSGDRGDHWQDATGSAIPRFFSDVAWDGSSLYAATFGGGVLRATVTTP